MLIEHGFCYKEFTVKVLSDLSKAEEEVFLALSEQDRKDFTRINEALTSALQNKIHIVEKVLSQALSAS